MRQKMQSWLQAVKDIEAYLDEHPDKDTYEADWPPDNFRDVLTELESQIEIWMIELYDPKDIVRMIRGSQPVYTNESFNYLTNLGVGRYHGGFVDEWRWESENSKCWDKPINSLAIIYKYYCQHKK